MRGGPLESWGMFAFVANNRDENWKILDETLNHCIIYLPVDPDTVFPWCHRSRKIVSNLSFKPPSHHSLHPYQICKISQIYQIY